MSMFDVDRWQPSVEGPKLTGLTVGLGAGSLGLWGPGAFQQSEPRSNGQQCAKTWRPNPCNLEVPFASSGTCESPNRHRFAIRTSAFTCIAPRGLRRGD